MITIITVIIISTIIFAAIHKDNKALIELPKENETKEERNSRILSNIISLIGILTSYGGLAYVLWYVLRSTI